MRYWYLGSNSRFQNLAPGYELPNPYGVTTQNNDAHIQCFDELKQSNSLNLPYCFSRHSYRQYDLGGGS